MAKAKKDKVTLEDALVPVGEQPYEVPGNWCWIKLLDAFENCTDSKKKLATKDYLEEGEFPIIDQGQNFIDGYTNNQEMVYNGELPIVIFGDHTRCIKYIDFKFVQGADGIKVLKPQKYWNSKAFYYALQNVDIPNMGYRRHYPLFKNYVIPLPPLAEQQRIVDQIENLFSKLDEAKEKAQDVIDCSKIRKLSIYREAFSGKLSALWRKTNSITTEWENIRFEECVERMQNGIAKRSGENGNLFGVLRLANLDDDTINVDDLREIKLTEKEQENYKLNINDIIMIRVNGSKENVGRQLLMKEEHDWAFCDHIIRINLKNNLEPAFLVMFSKTDYYRHYINEHMVSSAGQNTISRKGLSELMIPVPTIEEQKYIVATVENIITKELKVHENAECILDQIDLMKKSILAKAFRGELATNNPEEESSIELLKDILANQ
jgi:type I restriction enzyme S subunit